MTKRKKSNEDAVVAEETGDKTKAKREREPLDLATLKPEAAKCLANGEDAKRKLEVAAEALKVLGLEGGAKRLWKDAERAYAASVREARRIQKAGSKGEREAAKMEKKREKIVKLREQLEKLMAEATSDEAEAASDT